MIKLTLTINEEGFMEMDWDGVPTPFEAIRVLHIAEVNLLNMIKEQIKEHRIITPGSVILPGKN